MALKEFDTSWISSTLSSNLLDALQTINRQVSLRNYAGQDIHSLLP